MEGGCLQSALSCMLLGKLGGGLVRWRLSRVDAAAWLGTSNQHGKLEKRLVGHFIVQLCLYCPTDTLVLVLLCGHPPMQLSIQAYSFLHKSTLRFFARLSFAKEYFLHLSLCCPG